MKVLNALTRCLDLKEHSYISENSKDQEVDFTLIASVRMAAITSSEPPKTRLSSRVGSYSQIAVAFSTAAILVM